jgi:hypothetical protein
MYQPYSSSGQPERPPAPAPARTAVKLMYAGAAVSLVPLLVALPSIGDIKSYHVRWDGHTETAAQLSQLRPLLITLAIVGGLIVPAVWLWMARANGQGRNWARIWSTVLFGLATLQLTGTTAGTGIRFGVTAFGVIISVLTWLIGVAAVWLLWRPACREFFKLQGYVRVRQEGPRLPGPPPRPL